MGIVKLLNEIYKLKSLFLFIFSKTDTYFEVVGILNIFSALLLDEDFSIKIIDKSLKNFIKLMLSLHPNFVPKD